LQNYICNLDAHFVNFPFANLAAVLTILKFLYANPDISFCNLKLPIRKLQLSSLPKFYFIKIFSCSLKMPIFINLFAFQRFTSAQSSNPPHFGPLRIEYL